MKFYTHIYNDVDDLELFLSQFCDTKSEQILIQVFSGVVNPDVFMKISKIISQKLPFSHLLGATTAGEIYHGEMKEGSIVIGVSVFEKTRIKSKLYRFEKQFDYATIKEDLWDEDTKAFIFFSDGLKSDTEVFVKELSAAVDGVVIAGGRAADNLQLEKTFVFTQEDFCDNGCVIASLSSKELHVQNKYMLNWTPIGKEMCVTRCEGNILYELDGKPVIEMYRKYLGEHVVSKLPKSAMLFPLIIQKDAVEIARDPIDVIEQEGAIVYAGHFEVGDIIRFSFADFENIVGVLQEYYNDYLKYPSEAIYVYSCIARKALLGSKLKDELELLESLAPSCGFFTYGEFYQAGNTTELLNVTTTFLMISEKTDLKHKDFLVDDSIHFDPVKQTLAHLVKVTTLELEELAIKDTLTGLYNRSEYKRVIKNKLISAQRYKQVFGYVIVDIDHFKSINDTYGHKTGDLILQALAKVLNKHMREDDFIARWGGEEFIVLLNNVTLEGLVRAVEKFQKAIQTIDLLKERKITASFGVTLYKEGDDEQTLFRRADSGLYEAKAQGRDRFILNL